MISLLEYIGNTINERNPHFNKFDVNGVQLPTGEIIKFTDNKEKQFIGVSDNFGEAFYIRFTPQINFQTSERRIASTQTTLSAIKQCRLIAYSWKSDTNSETLMTKILTDLKGISFINYVSTQQPQIIIKRSNHNYIENITEEFKKEAKDSGGFGFVCISIDFDLKYYPSECGDCFEEELTNCLHD